MKSLKRLAKKILEASLGELSKLRLVLLPHVDPTVL